MADSWWETLLENLFNPLGTGSDPMAGYRPAAEQAGQDIKAEVEREEREALQAKASAAPTPQPTASTQANPNARENEQVAAAIQKEMGGVKATNPLYGNIPDGYVYLGHQYKERGNGNVYRDVKVDKIQNVIEDLNNWSEKKRTKFAELAVAAGLLKSPTINFDDLEPILGQLALRSAKLYQRGTNITPWALLERYGSNAIGDAVSAGPVTTTSTSRSINLSSGREANSLVDAALAQRLGRSATAEEKKKFLESLNTAEKKEPTVTKTTTTTSGTGTKNVNSDSSSTTSGGVNAGAFAEEWALSHNREEAGSYQALATYMPAFYQALESPV